MHCFFLQGYSGGVIYDGQYMANSSEVVVVTVNYRLGAMGFLVYRKGEEGPAGNFGLRVRVVVSVCLSVCLVKNVYLIANSCGGQSSIEKYLQHHSLCNDS